jgi:hypothetical protein
MVSWSPAPLPCGPAAVLRRAAANEPAMVRCDKNADRPVETWAVHRQDDNGNRFVVDTGLSREEAERLVAVYESRGHKQVYWAAVEQR